MAAPSRTKASNDFTGRQAAALAKQAAEEQAQKAKEMAMMTATEQQEFEDSVFDVTRQPDNPIVIDEVVEMGVELADHSVIVRVTEDVENMTFGYGSTYNFKAGGKYKVPKTLADRLGELGLLYERF